MQRVISFAAIVVLLVMMLPVLACAATPRVTRMEQVCCRQMHNKCSEMTNQGCCRTDSRSDLNQLPAHIVAAPILTLTMIAVLYPLLVDLPVSGGYLWHVPREHSPPGLLIAATTVLLI